MKPTNKVYPRVLYEVFTAFASDCRVTTRTIKAKRGGGKTYSSLFVQDELQAMNIQCIVIEDEDDFLRSCPYKYRGCCWERLVVIKDQCSDSLGEDVDAMIFQVLALNVKRNLVIVNLEFGLEANW